MWRPTVTLVPFFLFLALPANAQTVAMADCDDAQPAILAPAELPLAHRLPPPSRPLPSPNLAASSLPELGLLLALTLWALASARRSAGTGASSLKWSLFGALAILSLDLLGRTLWILSRIEATRVAVQAENFALALDTARGLRSTASGCLLSRLSFSNAVALRRLDLHDFAEKLSISAIHHGVGLADIPLLESAVDLYEPLSPEGKKAAIAARSRIASHYLLAGEPTRAEKELEASLALDFASDIAGNLEIAHYLTALDLAGKNDFEGAGQRVAALQASGQHLSSHDRTTVHGVVAQRWARFLLGQKPPKVELAAEKTAAAFASMNSEGLHLPFLICDHAAVQEPLALFLLNRQREEEAVAALKLSERLVPDRPFLASALPNALLAVGYRKLKNSELDAAVVALEDAYARPSTIVAEIHETLVIATFAQGSALLEARDFSGAIGALGRALQLEPREPKIAGALAEAFFRRGDSAMKRGLDSAAQEDYGRSVELSKRHQAAIDQRYALMPGTALRKHQLRSAGGWLNLPSIEGALPLDADDDGRTDGVQLFAGDEEKPIAFARLATTGAIHELLLLGDDNPTVIKSRVQDRNRDGAFDERTDYADGQAIELIVDSDSDARPDVQMSFEGLEATTVYLSGKILMRFKSAVIGEQVDPFNSADAYVMLFSNKAFLGRTETAINTQFPTWQSGITVDYKVGDQVRVELWDEDVVWDDLVDHHVFQSMPDSQILRMDAGKAAMEIEVEPTDLPPGYVVANASPELRYNVFQEDPLLVPKAADLIAGAHRAKSQARFNCEVLKWTVSTFLVPRLLPTKTPVSTFLRDVIVEEAVLEPTLCD